MELYLIRRQLLITACICVGHMTIGYNLGWTSPTIVKLQDPEQTPLPNVITDQEASWIGSILYVGALIGPYVTGVLANRKGRKLCLFMGAIITGLAFLLLALAKNLAMIYTARILIGLGMGILSVIDLVYIGEISSTRIRGVLLTLTGIASTTGLLLMYSVAPYVPYAVPCYIGIALSTILTVGLFFVPETPLYLTLNGEKEKAHETMIYLGRQDEVEKMLSLKEEELLIKQSTKQQWIEIISNKGNRRALFITLTINILQHMSGVIAVVLFVTIIFDLAGSSVAPDIATIMTAVAKLFTSVIATSLVEKAGRKLLLLISTGFCCLSLAVLGAYFYLDDMGNDIVNSLGWLPLVALIAFFLSYDLGFGIIPGTLIGEMFTSNVRSTGSTVTFTISGLIGFFLSSSFAAMIAYGPYLPFFVYSSSCGVAFLFTLVFVPETKGKTLLEIQEMLNK